VLNRAEALFLGCGEPAKDLGKSEFDFLSKDQATGCQASSKAVLDPGQPALNVEASVVDHEGTASTISLTRVPLKDNSARL
jgi:hypothetical protein